MSDIYRVRSSFAMVMLSQVHMTPLSAVLKPVVVALVSVSSWSKFASASFKTSVMLV